MRESPAPWLYWVYELCALHHDPHAGPPHDAQQTLRLCAVTPHLLVTVHALVLCMFSVTIRTVWFFNLLKTISYFLLHVRKIIKPGIGLSGRPGWFPRGSLRVSAVGGLVLSVRRDSQGCAQGATRVHLQLGTERDRSTQEQTADREPGERPCQRARDRPLTASGQAACGA